MKKRIKVSQVALYGILTLISVLWIIPVLFIFSLSVTPETSLSEVGYRLIPKEITFDAYTYMEQDPFPFAVILPFLDTTATLLSDVAYRNSDI